MKTNTTIRNFVIISLDRSYIHVIDDDDDNNNNNNNNNNHKYFGKY